MAGIIDRSPLESWKAGKPEMQWMQWMHLIETPHSPMASSKFESAFTLRHQFIHRASASEL
jgi:hypothetical protein